MPPSERMSMEQPNDATNVTSNLANGASVSSGKCEVSLLHNQEITFLAGDACLYSVVKQCALSLGWKLICEDANEIAKRNCHVVWIDRSFNDNLFLTIQPWQRINHFPGMTNICKKASMARNLELMKKEFPREYSFYPTTYVIPQNMSTFKSLFAPSGRSKSVYIIKPSGGAQGKGIFLTRKIEDLDQINSLCVAQQYIHNRLLIDKKKFDLRIYVLVTSCAPLRVYLFRGGLVRICAVEYERPNTTNMDERCMHLTNYAVNKHSDKYERDDEGGSTLGNVGCKRSINWFIAWLRNEHGEAAANDLWSKIGDMCVLTIISILPVLQREYAATFERQGSIPNHELDHCGISGKPDESTPTTTENNTGRSRCFEILGFDIMVDTDLKPSLIEVNHLPSWGTDSPLDEAIKSRVITQALSAINVTSNDKILFERAKRNNGLNRRRSTGITGDVGEKETKHNNQLDNFATPNKGGPSFFDSQRAEKRIRLVYEKYAPDKIASIKELLSRYRGYEEWLAMKIEEKYCNDNHEEVNSSSEGEDDDTPDNNPTELISEREMKMFEEEEKVLKDYDLIYPPTDTDRIGLEKYREMERYVAQLDREQQRRLTCPLQQKCTNADGGRELSSTSVSSRDSWNGAYTDRSDSMKENTKAPPTKKQIEYADRLSRGYSVEDTHVDKFAKRSSTLHNDSDAEENPSYHLIDRVRQSREISKEARKRAEKKLHDRSSKGIAIRQQTLGLDIP
jgi:tubulin polyglutamylase TTLL6/13